MFPRSLKDKLLRLRMSGSAEPWGIAVLLVVTASAHEQYLTRAMTPGMFSAISVFVLTNAGGALLLRGIADVLIP